MVSEVVIHLQRTAEEAAVGRIPDDLLLDRQVVTGGVEAVVALDR
jgi:hypothetical protein